MVAPPVDSSRIGLHIDGTRTEHTRRSMGDGGLTADKVHGYLTLLRRVQNLLHAWLFATATSSLTTLIVTLSHPSQKSIKSQRINISETPAA